jgi:protein phosphatase
MGGHAAGEQASRIVVEQFARIQAEPAVSVSEALAAVEKANAAILGEAATDGGHTGMGSTVTGLVAVMVAGSDHWMVLNVGDSRVYRLAAGRLHQLTTDHSEAEEMAALGRIDRATIRDHRRRNVLTRSLGSDPAPVADSWVFPPADRERFVLCSDGLTLELTDGEIAERALKIADPQALAEDLVRGAVKAGGRDNVTVIVVDGFSEHPFDSDEDTSPRPEQEVI